VSTGHLSGEEKPAAELYQMLGEGDTPKLYARAVKLDTSCDVPYGGGNSVDGRTVYVDRRLCQEIRSYRVNIRGMTSRQIIQAFLEHEHTEWAIDAGDNPVDVYAAAHGFAIAKEHQFVRHLRVDPQRYEDGLAPALRRCLARDPGRPPRDLWCGPYLDDPTPRDKELIRIFRAKGVEDAFKVSKIESEYGIGDRECIDCDHYNHGKAGEMGPCGKVCGIVRANRHCDYWVKKAA
jgi:hypothetical protein